MEIDGESREVEPGDAILIPAGHVASNHRVLRRPASCVVVRLLMLMRIPTLSSI